MKIISGGQSGGDLGGNYFAKKHNTDTEINAFKDFKPVSDNLPTDIKINYVCDFADYAENLRCRTRYNIKNSDFTIILLNKDIYFTKGSKLTYKECLRLKSDVLYIDINTHIGGFHDRTWSLSNHRVIQSLESARQIIKSKSDHIFVLNVAGQRDLDEYKAIEFLEKLLLN